MSALVVFPSPRLPPGCRLRPFFRVPERAHSTDPQALGLGLPDTQTPGLPDPVPDSRTPRLPPGLRDSRFRILSSRRLPDSGFPDSRTPDSGLEKLVPYCQIPYGFCVVSANFHPRTCLGCDLAGQNNVWSWSWSQSWSCSLICSWCWGFLHPPWLAPKTLP